MPSVAEILVFLVLAGGIGYWLDARRAHELARSAGQRACREAGVQLLDDTVELVRVRLRRDPRGRLAIQRAYRFEFSADGAHRHRGQLTLLGRRLRHCTLGS